MPKGNPGVARGARGTRGSPLFGLLNALAVGSVVWLEPADWRTTMKRITNYRRMPMQLQACKFSTNAYTAVNGEVGKCTVLLRIERTL